MCVHGLKCNVPSPCGVENDAGGLGVKGRRDLGSRLYR